ncbi:MAG: ISAs1 family transposase [Elainellaceae cyanobacterium]
MATGFGNVPPPGVPLSVQKLRERLLEHFGELEDPRIKRQPEHLLFDIVAIAILAILAGADDMVAIETYGKAKQTWLETFLALPKGIPSHDTFSRVLGLLDPQQLHSCFLQWVNQICTSLEINLIHIDGKTARGAYDREQSLKALHTVSAWASEHHLVLAQHRVESKSNEITAIPELLELLDIEGSIVTLDAMGTQRQIARQIMDQGGDYVLALKGNQGTLHQGVKVFFEQAQQQQWQGIEFSYQETTEAGHHRIEHRQLWVVPLSQVPELPQASKWSGLASLVMVKRTRQLWNKTTTEVCFYISSLEADATRLARAIRSHRGIENSLH